MRHVRRFLFAALAIGAMALVAGSVLAAPCPKGQCWNGSACVTEIDISGTLTAPSITCVSSTGSSITLEICGTGTYGAPAGFSVQMKSKAEFLADYNAAGSGAKCDNRGWNESPTFAAWSLSGQCRDNSPWSLGPGECVTLVIDNDFTTRYLDSPTMCGASGPNVVLTCGTEYVFRVRAHNYNSNGCPTSYDLGSSPQGPQENWTGQCVTGHVCATAACPPDGGCTFTWGYWKTHGPDELGCSPGNQENDWDLTEFVISDSEVLTQAQVCDIFHVSPGGSACGKGFGANAVVILQHQLFAAMLNVANGAIECPDATDAIEDAKALLASRGSDCIGVSTVLGQDMIAVKDRLAAYNSDICNCPVPINKPQAAPGAATETKSSTWGKVKVRYR